MAVTMGDVVIFGECRLRNLRTFDIKKNGEKVGEKTMVDVVTWGGDYQAEVDPKYAEGLKFGVTGRAIVTVELDSDKELKKFDGDAYQKTVYKFSGCRLQSFEVAK